MLLIINEYLESCVFNNLRRKILFIVIYLGGFFWFVGIFVEFKILYKLIGYVFYKKYW